MTLATTVLRPLAPKSTDHRSLWLALATLASLDALTTVVALALGAPEGNPLIAALIEVGGLAAVPLSQLVYVALAAGLVTVVDRGERWVLGSGVALSWLVVLNNSVAVLVLSRVVA